ncbi:EP0 [Suid alphaherpesvirus 1]|uniref:E3 ubiquitin-protein ligase ICP0 n=1 Tax=Suid herpesvirus 1 TaxID=10345 RepID=A0A2C9C317_SUHV|nr:EP0 [Suid alphaherpesvirus 1]
MGCTVSRRRTTTAEASSAWGIFGFYRPRSPSPPPQRLSLPLTVMDCPICLDVAATEAQTLPCMHKFCLDCIQRWTQSSTACPLCKARVTSILHHVDSDASFVETPVEGATDVDGEEDEPVSTVIESDPIREAVVDNIVEIIQEHGMNRQRVTEAMLPMFGANTHALVDTLFDISAQWMRRMQRRAPMSHQGVNYIDTSESEAHSDSEVSSPDEEDSGASSSGVHTEDLTEASESADDQRPAPRRSPRRARRAAVLRREQRRTRCLRRGRTGGQAQGETPEAPSSGEGSSAQHGASGAGAGPGSANTAASARSSPSSSPSSSMRRPSPSASAPETAAPRGGPPASSSSGSPRSATIFIDLTQDDD